VVLRPWTSGGGDSGVGRLRNHGILVCDLRSSPETRSKKFKGRYHKQEVPFLASRVSLFFWYQTLPRGTWFSAEIAYRDLPRHRPCLGSGSESQDL